MATTSDRPNGLVPVGTRNNSDWTAKVKIYDADASRTTANEAGTIFVGDPVKLEADGKITAAAAGDSVFGVAVGVLPINTQLDGFGSGTSPHGDVNLQRKHLPANVAGKVLVAVGPDVLYEVQEDADTSQLADTNIGENVDLIAPTAHGSTTTGLSLFELDSSTTGTATAQFRIWDRARFPGNDAGLTGTERTKWIVYINEDQFNSTTGV